MKEKEIIEKFFLPLAKKNKHSFCLKNDGALLSKIQNNEQRIVTTDSIIENIHFFENDPPDKIAQKALRVNISDLAAMGAIPDSYVLNITLSAKTNEKWLSLFSNGLKKDMAKYKINLLGGDTTIHDGPIIISITAFGILSKDKSLKKSTAVEKDLICISGSIGNSFLGLLLLKGLIPKDVISKVSEKYLIESYHLPSPKVELGNKLCDFASAATDISDGLISDLQDICGYSKVGANIKIKSIEFSKAAKEVFSKFPKLKNESLSAGDDYEIIFTISRNKHAQLIAESKIYKSKIFIIGEITKNKDIKIFDENNNIYLPKELGFQHKIIE